MEITFNDPSGLPVMDQAFDVVDRRDDVVGSARVDRALVVFDQLTQPTYALTHRKGLLDFTILDGRAPGADGEVALAPATARAYGVEVGDTVDVTLAGGEHRGETRPLRVVGIVLLPTTPHSSYDQGAMLTSQQLHELFDVEPLTSASAASIDSGAPVEEVFDEVPPVVPYLYAALDDDADARAVAAEIDAEVQPGLGAAPTTIPNDLVNLRNVRILPVLFGAFTILLAIGTLAHVSASVVRRRATDLAVLRTIGLTPRQTRMTLSWQATTVAVVGLVIGLPLGILLGRASWRWVAQSTPMLYVAPLGLLAVLLVVPVALVVANLLSLWPGRQAARLKPAEVLRTE